MQQDGALVPKDWDTGDHLAGQVERGEEDVEWWEHHDDDTVSVGRLIDAGRSHDSFRDDRGG